MREIKKRANKRDRDRAREMNVVFVLRKRTIKFQGITRCVPLPKMLRELVNLSW